MLLQVLPVNDHASSSFITADLVLQQLQPDTASNAKHYLATLTVLDGSAASGAATSNSPRQDCSSKSPSSNSSNCADVQSLHQDAEEPSSHSAVDEGVMARCMSHPQRTVLNHNSISSHFQADALVGTAGADADVSHGSSMHGCSVASHVMPSAVTVEELEHEWRLREHAISSINEGITIADPNLPDAPIVYVNDAFLRMTGYSHEEVTGNNCRFLQVGKKQGREGGCSSMHDSSMVGGFSMGGQP